MTRVRFSGCTEIRMGSPFQACEVSLDLEWQPEIPRNDFQDLFAESPDQRHIALVRWSIANNEPGFVIYTLDNLNRDVVVTSRYPDSCERIWWDDVLCWTAIGSPEAVFRAAEAELDRRVAIAMPRLIQSGVEASDESA